MATEPISVAYVVVAHRSPAQVARLVRRLAVPGTAFVIHVDRRSDPAVERELRRGVEEVARVHFLSPHRVYWAHYSLLDAILRALSSLRDLGLDPAHTVLTTGQDYPVVDPELIAARLEAESDRTYMQYSALPNYEWWPNDRGGLDRFERHYVRLFRRGMFRTPLRRRIPHDWRPYGGAAGMSLGRPHREYVQDMLVADQRSVRFFRHTNVADEGFFQTVLMNSPLRDSVVNDNLLFARWSPLANHPDLLGVDDIGEILASGKLFARKFDEGLDPRVLDELERRFGRPS